MASSSDDNIDQGRLDLVPMIDCVMLLLLFFILTTHFTSEDQRLSALLPTDVGPGTTAHPTLPPPQVEIAVIPTADGDAEVVIGGHEPVPIHVRSFEQRGGPELEAALTAFHRAIAERLAPYEQAGDRAAQVPVQIHCATRLPWGCALAVYDAVRGYEQVRLPAPDLPFSQQRAVAFAGPVIRGSAGDNERDELQRLGRMR